ncbi:MAG: hypothetical protein WBQ43_11230 [Terriglobales bacterium]
MPRITIESRKRNTSATNDHVRDEYGEIRRKRSDTLVGTLREEYGADFAVGFRGDAKLATVLAETGSTSLNDYLRRRPAPGRPATARDTAKALGVSDTRADRLINAVNCDIGLHDRCRDQDGEIHRKRSDTRVFAIKKKSANTYAKTEATKTRTQR